MRLLHGLAHDTFDVTVDDGHGVTTITVTVPIDPLPTDARRSTQL